MRPTIVFSSDSSEYENDESIPAISTMNNNNPQTTNQNLYQDENSYSYEDYSSEIVVVRASKPNNIIKRTFVSPKKMSPTINQKKKTEKPIIKLDDDSDSNSESAGTLNTNKNPEKGNYFRRKIQQIIPNKELGNQKEPINKNDNIDGNKNKIEDIKESSDFEDNFEKESEQKDEKELESEEESDPPIVKISHFEAKSSVTYAISRKLKSSIRGKRYYYYFYSNSTLKYCAKAKTRHPDSNILIYEGKNAHIKGKSQFILSINQESTNFSLKKSDESDEEIMTLKVFLDSALLMLPRHVDVQILPSSGISQMSLTTKKPKLSARGNWILDFHDKFTIPSEKNMIFVSSKDNDGTELLFIRKISPEGMEIDLCTNIPEICVFSIGLSIFLAKLR